MAIIEVRDQEIARRFLLQGLWLQRVNAPEPGRLRPILEWSLEIASSGDPLPPVGLVGDLGHLAFDLIEDRKTAPEAPAAPGFPAALARTYEDHVLGKLYADWTFERAREALRRYQGRDRSRGLAFLVNQFRERAGFDGVLLSPGIIKAALDRPAKEVLAQGWAMLERDGLLPLLGDLCTSLITATRQVAEVLGPEDVFELEHGTALAGFSQRLALRQVLQAAGHLEEALPRHRPRTLARRHEVPTRILKEDAYPVGGFSSLSNRGSMESLLHSQLAYMEQKDDRPDLFDVKFLRDELLYYARDDNQFLRRRRTFVFALFPDLVGARFKDAELPWQRMVLILGWLLAAVRKLSEWLSTDALVFEFLFIDEQEEGALTLERELLEMLLREQIANGTVVLAQTTQAQLGPHCSLRARKSLCHCLTISTIDRPLRTEVTVVTPFLVQGSCPVLGNGDPGAKIEGDDSLGSWSMALGKLFEEWI